MCTILTSLGVFLLSMQPAYTRLTGDGGGTKEDDSKKAYASSVHAYLHGVRLLAGLARPED
jgi:hypothetical protein